VVEQHLLRQPPADPLRLRLSGTAAKLSTFWGISPGLDSAAATLDKVAADLGGARDQLGGHAGQLAQIWQTDQAAPAALAESATLGTAASESAQSVAGGAAAVRTYATAVADARHAVQDLQRRADTVADQTRAALARAPAEQRQQILDQAQNEYRQLGQQHQQALDTLERAAGQARTRLESLVPTYRAGTVGSVAAASTTAAAATIAQSTPAGGAAEPPTAAATPATPAADQPTYKYGGVEIVDKDGKQYARIHLPYEDAPKNIDVPLPRGAKGFEMGWWEGHQYDVRQNQADIPFDQSRTIIADQWALNPTPGFDNKATPEGTPNNYAMIVAGSVTSYVVPSSDPSRFTDAVVNYTDPDYILAEGAVVHVGTREDDGSVTLHTYGIGNSAWQGKWELWRLGNDPVWWANEGEVADSVRQKLGITPPNLKSMVQP
jgi:hypothetical protein